MAPRRACFRRMTQLVAAALCACALSCRADPAPKADTPPAAAGTPDEQVLLALDYYEPVYKVDDAGRVTHLRLTGRHLPSDVMVEVGKLTELHGLDCYGSTLSDEGLAQLKDLQKLRSIGLGATSITDKGLSHLEKLQNLQWVWVPGGTTSEDGRQKLKEARPDMNIYPQ
jgi:hypothetical protein